MELYSWEVRIPFCGVLDFNIFNRGFIMVPFCAMNEVLNVSYNVVKYMGTLPHRFHSIR